MDLLRKSAMVIPQISKGGTLRKRSCGGDVHTPAFLQGGGLGILKNKNVYISFFSLLHGDLFSEVIFFLSEGLVYISFRRSWRKLLLLFSIYFNSLRVLVLKLNAFLFLYLFC